MKCLDVLNRDSELATKCPTHQYVKSNTIFSLVSKVTKDQPFPLKTHD